MAEYLSYSAADTERLGAALAACLRKTGKRRAFVALFGEMGVGKTAFCRGFCAALGVSDVHSPTYAIVHEYRRGELPIFHFDMYRVESEDDLLSIGYDDYLSRDGYALCEWSEHIEDELPADAIRITLLRTDGGCGRKLICPFEI